MIYHYMRNLKKEKNLSNQDLADLSGVPLGTVNRVMSGQTENPSFDTICELIKAMDGSLDEAVGIRRPHEIDKELYENTIKEKDKWIKRLFIFSCALIGIVLVMFTLDTIVSGIGWFRY